MRSSIMALAQFVSAGIREPRISSRTYLDVRELGRLSKRRVVPVAMPHPFVKVGIAASDIPQVALEMLNIDRVEADDGRVEPDVCFCHAFAMIVGAWRPGQLGLCTIQRGEERLHVLEVRLFGGCEARLVDAVVDVVVRPLVRLLDLLLQVVWQ